MSHRDIGKEKKMELCYDGALVMPKNFVAVNDNEMEYVTGGWSWNTLGKSLKNLYNRWSFASAALRGSGLTLGTIAKVMAGTATYLYAKIATTLGAIAAANWVVGIVIGITASVAMFTMGTWVCF